MCSFACFFGHRNIERLRMTWKKTVLNVARTAFAKNNIN